MNVCLCCGFISRSYFSSHLCLIWVLTTRMSLLCLWNFLRCTNFSFPPSHSSGIDLNQYSLVFVACMHSSKYTIDKYSIQLRDDSNGIVKHRNWFTSDRLNNLQFTFHTFDGKRWIEEPQTIRKRHIYIHESYGSRRSRIIMLFELAMCTNFSCGKLSFINSQKTFYTVCYSCVSYQQHDKQHSQRWTDTFLFHTAATAN